MAAEQHELMPVMKLSKIMVYQDDNAHCVNWTTYAAHLADQFNAHLTGFFVGQDPTDLKIFDDALASAIQKNIDPASMPSAVARAQFNETLSHFNLPASFKIANEKPSLALRREARFYNIVVTGQPDTSSHAMQDEKSALSHLLIGSGRPVIVVPRNYKIKPAFNRVTIAWDGGRESTRALFDSLPFIANAESIEIITVKTEDGSRPFSVARPDEISSLLSDMGLQNQHKILESNGQRSGRLILEKAQEHQSDIIVMGAYAHSRWRELVLGSATRSLIKHTTLPVLMSH